MNRFTRAALALPLLLAAPVARAADPADLFPPDTAAYAEVNDPAAVAPHLATLVKGSALENGIPFVHDRKDKAKDPRDAQGKPELALLALLGSPELAGEAGKLRVAGGLLGFKDTGEPEMALAVGTTDSPAAGLAARAFLTMGTNVRRVAVVSNVPVFQFRQPTVVHDPNTGRPGVSDKPPQEGAYEPTFAYTPGLFVVGTSKAAITPVLKRFLGEEKAGLAGVAPFKAAAAAHRKPGVFFFVNAPVFCSKLDAAVRKSGNGDPDLYGWLKLVANPRAVKSVAGTLRFRDGGVSADVTAAFNPGQPSPLFEFLRGTGARVELLHSAPRPVGLALAVTFPEKDRPGAVIGFLDALAGAAGGLGRTPGEAIREMEQKFKTPIADGLIGKTRAVTVVFPVKQELPKDARPLPVVVVHAETADAAAAWEAFLPKLVADLAGQATPAEPVAETLNGVKVFSLPGAGLPWKAAVHFARKGNSVGFGLDRRLVGAAVAAEPGGSVAGGTLPAALPGGDYALLGTVSVGEAIRFFSEARPVDGPVKPVGPPGGTGRRPSRPFRPGPVDPETPESNPSADEAKARADFLGSFNALPPATLAARRAGDELRFELFQPRAAEGGLAPVINAGVGWLDKYLNRFSPDGRPGYYGGYERFDRE